ncbi:precorrin-2 dehydrogenase/sirohydrochlorin ferrochelatase family protein [Glacieibacterium frigidum]|uniref:precorrin-2 dehydrogenase n=1 Tax=Glacieibacterium frigidum TaxID=2593303 RepID=A0A552U9D0_9SPHN|nr:NAD(P)-dependent oxidoreductase [Glacieibacterium frigidum]TRW14823.1 siroheme synthase [Glacieibacterium frigidum]
MDSLPIFVRLSGQPVLLIGGGPAADAKARLIEGAGGVIVREPAMARIAFVALDDADAAAAIAARLKADGCLVNVVDKPALCDFTVPAIVDRSPVIVAIGTGGASASLAKVLRARLEALLPATLGDLARRVFAARGEVAARHPTVDARRRFWDAAMAPGAPLDPFGEAGDIPFDGVRAADSLTEIALASADPDDLTIRQLRALGTADLIVHPAGVAPAILDRARRDADRVVGDALPDPLPSGRVVWLR